MKQISTLLFTLLISVCFLSAKPSHGTVKGAVSDSDGNALPFATVILFNSADSSMTKAGYTNEDGEFSLTPIPVGSYWLKVTFTSMAAFVSDKFSLSEGQTHNHPAITLKNADTEVDEVKIRAQKPLITVKPDMTVFNVEASTNAIGSNALELLRKAPGVVVDNNDNIMLQGKSGVRIYIDGKPSPLTSDDLAAYLKSMQSNQIEAIEIITNPSAKYDAEGNAGILNIRLKKNKNLGANGNLDLGYAIGRFSKYQAGLSGNYRNKKINLFGSVNGGLGKNYNFINLNRTQNGVNYDQTTDMFNDGTNVSYKAGADIYINEKNTLGIMANGFTQDKAQTSNSTTFIGHVDSATFNSTLLAFNNSDEKRSNNNFNLNYRFEDRKKSTSWNVDADYGYYKNSTEAYQPNTYYAENGTTVLSEAIFTTIAPTKVDIATFKFDHERPLLKGKLGFGAKTSWVITDNDFKFYDEVDGADTLNLDRSNRFEYTENVNAAYATWQRQFGKWGVSAGVRAEQTKSNGELTSQQSTGNDTVTRSYLNLFPSGGLTYSPSQKHMFRLNYSRRIDRPRYQDLNPFSNRINELTYQQGNPFLRPQYSHSVELSHVFMYMVSTSLKYTRTTDLMTRITDTTEVTRSFISQQNLGQQDVISLYLGFPMPVTKWWSTYTNTGAYHTRNRADFGEGKEIDLGRYTFSLYHQSTFKLPKDISFEVSGFYNSPSIWGANYLNDKFWGMEVGARKKFLQGRGSFKVALSDIFQTMRYRGVQEYGGLHMIFEGGWESRQLKLNFSYLFGNSKVKSASKRKTGMEDEGGRASGGGN